MTARSAVAELDTVAPGDPPRFSQRLLEELIYERVRTHIDLLQLGWFESELDASIGRVLATMDDPGAPPPDALARVLMDDAWSRIEAEWREQRAADPPECPLCEADLAVPDDTGDGAARPGAARRSRSASGAAGLRSTR